MLQNHKPEQCLLALFLWTTKGFLGVLCQENPLMWLHQAHYDLHKVTSKFDQTFQFVLKKYMLTRKTYGRKPEKVIFFFPLKNTQAFWVDTIPFQEMVSGFIGSIDNHFPKNKFLVELLSLQIEIPTYSIPSSRSISYVTLAFSDANKSKYEILIKYKIRRTSHI